ncbi:MAG: hypothetical protein HRU38_21845 [Saccharospirillaceae bacterium]|nr:hypothetical protein [Pseudomonadales bacterium]NRB81274.1 hypothetical protein [Saccharospirillaceae bacterium]
MKIKLLHVSEINRYVFDKSLTWAQYYEPSDIDTLVNLGYDRTDVTSQLKIIGWSDEYWFPVPNTTDIGSFMFEYRKAKFKTLSGKVLDGFLINSGHAITLFGNKKDWSVNVNLLNLLKKNIAEVKDDLGLNVKENLLPLEVQVSFKGIETIFGKKG